MPEGIVVNGAPITLYKGRYQQNQGTLRLVEIGNQFIYNAEAETRDDDNARTAYQVSRV